MTSIVPASVVITGAAHGIGLAVAEACAARGDRLFLLDIDASLLSETAERLGSVGSAVLDVSDSDAVERCAALARDELGELDLIVHAAGVTVGGRVLDMTPADHRWVLDVNLVGTVYVATAFGRLLARQPAGGALVLTGSEHSLGVPHVGSASYTASKHGVLGFADVLRREVPPTVRVSVLCPGLVATDLWAAGSHRPDGYGGPTTAGGGAQAVMAEGLPAADVAAAVLAGVARGDFLIFTHGHVGTYAQARYDEVMVALDEQQPERDGRYEVSAVVQRLREA